jgi:hypothetical protein
MEEKTEIGKQKSTCQSKNKSLRLTSDTLSETQDLVSLQKSKSHTWKRLLMKPSKAKL